MRTRKIVSGISVAAALALALGACGGSDAPKAASSSTTPSSTTPSTTPRDGSRVVLASIRTTAAAKTARVAMTVTEGSDSAHALTMDGAVDFSTGDSSFTMDLGDVTPMFSGSVEMRSVAGTMYMKLPESFGALLGGGAGTKWLAIKDPTGGSVLGGELPSSDQADPAQFLAALAQISDDAKDVGTETVRGVETTHFHATLDFGKIADKANLPAGFQDTTKDLFGKLPSVPVDVFVDKDGLVRRISVQIDPGSADFMRPDDASSAGASAQPTTATIDFYDFGAPVQVAAPPADQVVDLKDLAKNFGFGGGGALGGLGDLGGLGGSPTTVPTKTS